MLTKVNVRYLEFIIIEASVFGDITNYICAQYEIAKTKVQLRLGRQMVDSDFRTLSDYKVRENDIVIAEILDESIAPKPGYSIVEFLGIKSSFWLAVWPSDTILELKRAMRMILGAAVHTLRSVGADLPDDICALQAGISQWSTIEFFACGETPPLPDAMFCSSPSRHIKTLPKYFRRCNSYIFNTWVYKKKMIWWNGDVTRERERGRERKKKIK
jgi:hypothetical protein